MINNTEDTTPIDKKHSEAQMTNILEKIDIHINVVHSNTGIVQTQRET